MEKIKIIKKRPNKYILKYDRSLDDIAQIFGVSKSTIHNWDKNEEKRKWMESILKNL
ncbi:hypothetical protein ES705_42620 [subsurface metagenome]